MADLFNHELLSSFDATAFLHNRPCPWFCFSGFLEHAAFRALHAAYPPLELFERHQELPRINGQRPHNRSYLALEQSLYGDKQAGERGCARLSDLSPSWQRFVQELRTNTAYLNFIRRLLGVEEMHIRFAWHVAGAGDDVSPHRDSAEKIGTQIFYFNSSADWDERWGGGTVFLSHNAGDPGIPEVGDFAETTSSRIADNRCVLFKNTSDAWHAVERLRCPPERVRRVFNVIFEYPRAVPSPYNRASVLRRIKRILRGNPFRPTRG